MQQILVTPEQFEEIKKLMESDLERALQRLKENPSSLRLEDYCRALDQLSSWGSYPERFDKACAAEQRDAKRHSDSVKHAELLRSTFSEKERRRERWSRYAAAAMSCEGVMAEVAAEHADKLLVQEQMRFGKTAGDPETVVELAP